jgi:hypothetical protein
MVLLNHQVTDDKMWSAVTLALGKQKQYVLTKPPEDLSKRVDRSKVKPKFFFDF